MSEGDHWTTPEGPVLMYVHCMLSTKVGNMGWMGWQTADPPLTPLLEKYNIMVYKSRHISPSSSPSGKIFTPYSC